ncbi:hypothetical protein BCR43DRAFT_491590 [Syncephalastrum racemosum]|uniref:VPS9 domain-containing protein n=1 Tax=Syncephalastrum racemosum TaxID=13706 RepID=A0A1X2HC53_SYNRA|nr:hypothetical protein BCR43DRAFT_491590 [Syncephalastrum racemosum]
MVASSSHVLLENILKEPRLVFPDNLVIVLLPPEDLLPPVPFPYDFLAEHIVSLPVNPNLSCTENAKNGLVPRPSLSASSVLSRIASPRQQRSLASFKTSSLFDNGSQSSLHSARSRSNSHAVGASAHEPAVFTSLKGTTVSIGQNLVITAKHRLRILRDQILFNDDDCITHVLLYLDHASSSDPKTDTIPEIIPQSKRYPDLIKIALKAVDNTALTNAIQKYCDRILNETNINAIHTQMKDLLEETSVYVADFLKTASAEYQPIPLQDQLYQAFECHIMEQTYDVVFFKLTQLMLPLDEEVSAILESVVHIDMAQVGLPPPFWDKVGRDIIQGAIDTLTELGSYRTPAEKLDCMLEAVTKLTHPVDEGELTGQDSDTLVTLLLLTVIRCRIPHLMANLTYMRDFTFETNVAMGRYGFALSTLEGVIHYILESRSQLATISNHNLNFWRAISSGDLGDVVTYCRIGVKTDLPDVACDMERKRPASLLMERRSSSVTIRLSLGDAEESTTPWASTVRNQEGDNALLLACQAGQPRIVSFLLPLLGGSGSEDVNVYQETPLMKAIQAGSMEVAQLLLDHDRHTQLHLCSARDIDGNTAMLHACALGNVRIIWLLQEHGATLFTYNHARQGPLHLVRTHAAFLYILQHFSDSMLTWRNCEGRNFMHTCKDTHILRAFLDSAAASTKVLDYLFDTVDLDGHTPLMTWAAQGRVDLMHTFSRSIYSRSFDRHWIRVDTDGNTALHHLASALDEGIFQSAKGELQTVLSQFKPVANAREWIRGKTALHIVLNAKLSESMIPTVREFVHILVTECDARLDALDQAGRRPIHGCRNQSIRRWVDEIALKKKEQDEHFTKKSGHLHDYDWTVTRPIVSRDRQGTSVAFNVYSDSVGQGDSGSRSVERSLEDFMLLRRVVLHENPEAFMPTLRHMVDPSQVDLRPPPSAIIEDTTRKIQHFMDYLQQHPTLRESSVVQTFVRTPELKKDVFENNSFARRKLKVEQICDSYRSGSDLGGSDDEEYFFSFAQNTITHLRDGVLDLVRAGRKVSRGRQEFQDGMLHVAQRYQTLLYGDADTSAVAAAATMEVRRKKEASQQEKRKATAMMIRVCANLTCDTAGLSAWDELVQNLQAVHDLTDGILMALQRPFWLLNRRMELRMNLEQQRDALQRAKNWNDIFSTQDQRRSIEQHKEQVIKTSTDLERVGSQITNSHQMISDEMAHFQRVHSDQVSSIIRKMAQAQLARERLTLSWLLEAKDQWIKKNPNPL